jgi:hypothetical protein
MAIWGRKVLRDIPILREEVKDEIEGGTANVRWSQIIRENLCD